MSIHEHINNEIWELYLEAILNSEIRELDIPKYIDQILEIERNNFSHLYQQDDEDILDDFKQPNYRGLGIFDENNNLQGYVYGYYQPFKDLIEFSDFKELNLDHIEIYDTKLVPKYDNHKKMFRLLKKLFGGKNSFYVSNLAINKQYRSKLHILLLTFFKSLRSQKVDYLSFDALTDTQNLIFSRGSKNMNDRLLNRFGLSPVISYSSIDDEFLGVFKLKD